MRQIHTSALFLDPLAVLVNVRGVLCTPSVQGALHHGQDCTHAAWRCRHCKVGQLLKALRQRCIPTTLRKQGNSRACCARRGAAEPFPAPDESWPLCFAAAWQRKRSTESSTAHHSKPREGTCIGAIHVSSTYSTQDWCPFWTDTSLSTDSPVGAGTRHNVRPLHAHLRTRRAPPPSQRMARLRAAAVLARQRREGAAPSLCGSSPPASGQLSKRALSPPAACVRNHAPPEKAEQVIDSTSTEASPADLLISLHSPTVSGPQLDGWVPSWPAPEPDKTRPEWSPAQLGGMHGREFLVTEDAEAPRDADRGISGAPLTQEQARAFQGFSLLYLDAGQGTASAPSQGSPNARLPTLLKNPKDSAKSSHLLPCAQKSMLGGQAVADWLQLCRSGERQSKRARAESVTARSTPRKRRTQR